jgi:hypothetical protein
LKVEAPVAHYLTLQGSLDRSKEQRITMAFDGLEFKWTAGVFGTNNAHMDDEHAGLFTAIDRLDAERTLEAYESLAGLVIQHFKDEEGECGLDDAHKVSGDRRRLSYTMYS